MTWLSLIMLAGCAHKPQSVQLQAGDIERYHAMALHALSAPEVWGQHHVVMPFTERNVDDSRKVLFNIMIGHPPIVAVWIPTTETNRINPFVVFEFDHASHELKTIGLGSSSH